MGTVFTNACCCKESNIQFSKRKLTANGKEMPDVPVHVGQHRAQLQIKSGGFSIGAFAATNRGNLEDFYDVEKTILGEGSYGSVQKCTFKDTGQWRAVKGINKALVKNTDQFREEVAIMRLLDHPNIVRLYETFEDTRTVYLVLELCTGGELFDRIVADGKFSEQVGAYCVQSMLRAINYMHQNYIMHRDLKPENWLLAESKVAICDTDLKLIDFGLSKRFQPGEFVSTKAGTPYYVAPEVLDGRYAEKSDVWSIGVIMYILLCGTPPFSGTDTVAVLDSVRRARPTFDKKEWKSITKDAKEMLKAMLIRDPNLRPSASDALQNTWLSNKAQDNADHSEITMDVMGSLKSFSVMNKLKKASLNVIVTQLNDAQLRELKALFISMDENNDGTLSVQEIKEGLGRAGVSLPIDLNAMMEQIDTDGSGVIDYTEFIAATMDKRKYMEEEVCWRAFKFFDVDGSGMLDRHEVVRLMGVADVTDVMQVDVTQQEVDQIMLEVDINGDGLIDFEEFMVMMRRMPQRPDSHKSRPSIRDPGD